VTIIRPLSTDQEDYIYKEGEDILESKTVKINFIVFFLIRGSAGFVLPRFCNRIYLEI